jgi:predicted permease
MQAVFEKIAVMFIMMAIGFLLGKLKIITNDGNRVLSNISLFLVSPLLSFISYQREFSASIAKNLLVTLGLTAVLYAVQIALVLLFIPKKRKGSEIERMSLIFSNCGYIGIPLVQSVFGNDGIIFLTMNIAVFYVLTWTLGVSLMTGKMSIKQTAKNLCTPAIFAVILGVIFFVFRIDLPDIIHEPLQSIGDMNTPLAMLIAGSTLAGTNILGCLRKWRIYLLSAVRLIILPVICLLCLFAFTFIGVDRMVITIVLIAMACPSAVITTMFSHRFGGDSVYASEIFAVTTILSAATIPFIMWLLSLLGISAGM